LLLMTATEESPPPPVSLDDPAQAIEPPSVRPFFVKQSNRIAGTRRLLRFAWNGQPAQLVFEAVRPTAMVRWKVEIQLSGHAFSLFLDQLPDPGRMRAELAGIDLSLLPVELACAVLQSCMEEVQTSLSRHGLDLRVISFSAALPSMPPGESLVWQIHRGEAKPWLEGVLVAEDAALEHLANLVTKAPVEQGPLLQEMAFPLQLSAGRMRCDSSLLKTLELHDVLLANVAGYFGLGECELLLRGKSIGIAIVKEQLCTFKNLNLNGTSNMAETSAEPFSLDQLEVELTFIVGQTKLTLGELRSLSPGATFELGTPVGQAVSIFANGCAFGKGELLEIGGRVGVRVTELGSAS